MKPPPCPLLTSFTQPSYDAPVSQWSKGEYMGADNQVCGG